MYIVVYNLQMVSSVDCTYHCFVRQKKLKIKIKKKNNKEINKKKIYNKKI